MSRLQLRFSGACTIVLSSLGIGCLPAQVFAQAAPAQDASSSSAEPAGITEVIVSAQRRSAPERARDVPLSITAQTGDQLEQAGITDTAGLGNVTPGLKMMRTGAYTQPTIRGISTQTTQVGNDANVAVYVDGVYQPSQAADTFDLPDVSRVEVLKGPQGTLFGRNATGGAIQIFTLEPGYETTGKIEGTYGNFDSKTVKGFISAPIVQDFAAFSLSGYYTENEGYYRDLDNNDRASGRIESSLVRGKVLLEPTDAVRILATGFYSNRKDASASAGIPLKRNTVDVLFPGSTVSTDPYHVAYDLQPALDVESYGGSVRLEADIHSGRLTALSSYAKYDILLLTDATYGSVPGLEGTNYYLTQPERASTHEITYASDSEQRFSFVTGAHYYDAKGSYFPIRVQNDFPPFPFDVEIYSTQTSKAYAFFGELYYKLTDDLKIIAGGRYSSEEREHIGATTGTGFPVPTLYEQGKDRWSNFTPRFSVLYEVTPTTNVYFTYSQGFKSGGFNSTVVAPPGSPPAVGVSPEELKAYETGVKSRAASWLDLTAAVFYYDYSDIQVQGYTSVNGVPLGTLQNAASARVYGLDFDATAQFLERFSVRAGVSILDAKYEDFPAAAVTIPTGSGGNVNVPIDASGNHLVRAPDATVTLTANYAAPLAGGKLNLSSTVYYSSKFYLENSNRIVQPDYTTVGARAEWSPDNSGLSVALWGRNLTDETVIQSLFSTELADGASFDARRTYGVTVGYRF